VQAARIGLRVKEIGVPRLYLDPNRVFGGGMDDAEQRLAYYRRVIADAVADIQPACAPPVACCGTTAPGRCR
jgi:dolichol-phosphate mannosyltransferase